MSENKKTVNKYMDAYRVLDHEMILSCLADDVSWEIPGAFKVKGKAEFDKKIEGENFTGKPDIQIKRTVEEGDIVISEGDVRCTMKSGEIVTVLFCDVFQMQNGKIKKLTSYLVNT